VVRPFFLGFFLPPGAAADETFTIAPAVVPDDLSLNYCLPLGTGTCRQMQYVDLRAGRADPRGRFACPTALRPVRVPSDSETATINDEDMRNV
jgi:hypothetical protein